jgi:hypothetical protein
MELCRVNVDGEYRMEAGTRPRLMCMKEIVRISTNQCESVRIGANPRPGPHASEPGFQLLALRPIRENSHRGVLNCQRAFG